MAYAVRHEGQAVTASGLDVLAGLWLLISPFTFAFRNVTAAVTNDVIFGIIIGVLALYRVFNPAKGVGVSWLNAVLGLWVLISPWVLRFSDLATPMKNNVIMGIIVIILAAWSALATQTHDNRMNTPQT